MARASADSPGPLPHARERVAGWRAARRRGRMLLALDFDGTLAPIVPRPEDARMPDAVRAAVGRLAARADTDVAIVSGRALADARARVGLADVTYAGNHGLEIEGPGVRRVHERAEAARDRIDACARRLERALQGIAGAYVEHKSLTLSVHYRRVAEQDHARVREAVRSACQDPALHVTDGKRVVEVRPAVEWDKGRATLFLLDALEADHGPLAVSLFIGDDRTDEDAFRALAERGGVGVVVGDPPPADTAATSYVRSPDEVAALLEELADGA